MNIAFFELEPFEKDFFSKEFSKHTLTFSSSPLNSRNAKKYANADIVVVFTFSKINKTVLDKLPKLSCITTMSTGYDHIDLEEASKRKIKVLTVPQYGQNTVAQHAFGLLLALNRNIVEAVLRTRLKEFNYKGLIGVDLENKTIGILGAGKIGQYMIKYAKSFGMNVLVYDKYADKSLAKTCGFTYSSLNNLCKKSDFISIHLPLLAETKHLISDKEFSLMKKDCLLINTSRGGLIDTRALLVALDKKQIAGCALDVLESEGDLKKEARFALAKHPERERLHLSVDNTELLFRKNVIITPHLAFYTKEAVQRIADTTLKNIKSAIAKKHCNVIN
jgi:D-lactate dehydrogenase